MRSHRLSNTPRPGPRPELPRLFLRMTLGCALLLGLSACGSASYVRKDENGGRLALHGSYGFAMGDARTQVVAHCKGPFEQRDEGGFVRYRCLDESKQFVMLDEPSKDSAVQN